MLPITLSLIGLFAITLLALVVVAFVLAGFSAMRDNKVADADARPAENPPSSVPILSPHLAGDLEQLWARERQLLTQYKWIDEKAGFARIPIGRAIDILAARSPQSAPQQNAQGASHE